MKKTSFRILLVAFVLCCNTAFGQIKKFSGDSQLFFKELQTFFEANTKKDELMTFYKGFKTFWESGALSDADKEQIVDNSNAMLKKSARAYPNFLNYYTAVQVFFDKKISRDNYKNWNAAYLYLLNSKSLATTDNFVTSTIDLLQNATLYSSNSLTWRVLQFKDLNISFQNNQAIVRFAPADIICEALKNEMSILKADGYFSMFDNTWHGKGGMVTWERSGFVREDVNATLSNYTIDMTKSSYTADSVWFINSNYYDKKIQGKLEDKVIATKNPDQINYPKFVSYQTVFLLKNVYPNVDYRGGFSMNGSRFIGSGTPESLATLTFRRGDSVLVRTRSLSYVFRNEGVVSQNSAVSIYIQKDSIYHPGLEFRYDIATRQVTLLRNESADNLSRTPFFNSYHQIDMDVPQMTWKIDSPEMFFGGLDGSNSNNAVFESANYFRESRYMEIGMYDRTHPLVALKNVAEQQKSNTFPLSELVKYLRMPENDVRHLCLDLSFRGLIKYNRDKSTIEVLPRAFEYLNARVGKIDYDVIQFKSVHDVKGLHNAKLNLKTNELDMVGVSRIQVSDSQNVIFFPRGSQVVMSKNRNFRFDGIVAAGLFTYYGRGFDFNYEEFKVNLQNVDSLRIKVESFTPNKQGTYPLVDIKNSLEYITGDIRIDAPNNKSSRKKIPEYPIFNSKQDSYVYYDSPSIYGGVYKREKFYFKVSPFVIDSLNSFSTKGLGFDGALYSADIFETLTERIAVQPDYSLGFVRATGAKGLAMYKGKATFIDTINLSFKGLRGNGTINYLQSQAVSRKGFVFFPDSTNGIAEKYTITAKKGVNPDARGEDVAIHWEPYNDRFVARERGKKFQMYGDSTTLSGGLVYGDAGLRGFGVFTFNEAQITSNTFKFKDRQALADTANFNLISKSSELNELAFKTTNVNTKVDFDTKKATFVANDSLTVVQFPKNKYISYLKQFSWDLVTKEIELGNYEALKNPAIVPNVHFYSVHPRQDTLNFYSGYAKYDMKKYIIQAYKVPYIDVANSRIMPHTDSIVRVFEDANMQTVANAEMYADRSNRYHKIYKASFDIKGKLAYEGTGTFDYVDETQKRTPIALSKIAPNSDNRTVASGTIAEDANFSLSPAFKYYGAFGINSWRKNLQFDGNVLVDLLCTSRPPSPDYDRYKPAWYAFKSEIDPAEIFIPISKSPTDIYKNPLGTSLYLAYRPTNVYAAFMTPKYFDKDIPLIDASGYLYFDKNSKRYKIGSREKILNDSLNGNLVAINRENCNVYGEGSINLGLDLGQVKYGNYGTITHNGSTARTTLETVAYVDFYFDDKTLKAIGDTVLRRFDLLSVDMTTKKFRKGLTEALGVAEANKLLNEIQLNGTVKNLPKALDHSITFSSLDLVWDTTASAFRSAKGVQIGVLSIGGVVVNKMVTGYVEYAKLYRGDMLTIYLELDPTSWIFFHYENQEMLFVSSNAGFNTAIDMLKEAKRTMQVPKKEAQYKFSTTSEAWKTNVINMIRSGAGYSNFMPPTQPPVLRNAQSAQFDTEAAAKTEEPTETEEETNENGDAKSDNATQSEGGQASESSETPAQSTPAPTSTAPAKASAPAKSAQPAPAKSTEKAKAAASNDDDDENPKAKKTKKKSADEYDDN
ncbi:MAG: hypothetical protein LBU90_09600 [Bacteroidales bacterium]|jgi:hypothetical protein|nr:hypothetical protein [Bacteroidales bacterium]